MAFELIWSPSARLDLWDILSFVKESDPQAASELGRRIFRAIERLPAFPESGRVVPEFADPALREIIQRPLRIVYRIRPEARRIEIVRVWHSARGVPGL